jgi:hypothetical protein
MKARMPLFVLAAVLVALVFGLTVLFRLRLSQGDVFPQYSSLRADPLGLRALHDSLAQLPGLHVARRFMPLRTLEQDPPRTIVLAGLRGRSWHRVTREQFDALDGAVKAGSRLVIAFRARQADAEDAADDFEFEPIPSPAKKKGTAEKKAADKKPGEEPAVKKDRRSTSEEPDDEETRTAVPVVDLAQRWGIAVKERFLMDRAGKIATRVEDARSAALPVQVPWRSDLYFKAEGDAGWRDIYRRAGEGVLVERSYGRGSIVLASDAYFLSNEALQRDRAPALLAWVVGSNSRVVFDEAHLGVVANPGVAALARRYGLSGAFFTLVLLAALFVWRRMALFVPPAPVTRDLALQYHPAAGLEALLRRAVPADQVVDACATEWMPTARESDRQRAQAVLAAERQASVVDRYNAVVRALKKRTKANDQ